MTSVYVVIHGALWGWCWILFYVLHFLYNVYIHINEPLLPTLHTAPVTSLRHRSLMCVSEWEDESRAHNTTSRAPLKEGDYFTPGSWWAAPEIQATLSCPSIVLRSERSWRLRGGGMLNTPGAQCPAPHNPTHSAKCIHAHKLSISNWRSESFLRKYWKAHCLQLEPNKPVNRQTAYHWIF